MGNVCQRRAPAEPWSPSSSDTEPEEPEEPGELGQLEPPEDPPRRPRPLYYPTKAFHQAAIQRRRHKFGASWKECGQAKASKANLSAQDHKPVPSWSRMVEHRLIQNRHHNNSQILKEVKRSRLAEL